MTIEKKFTFCCSHRLWNPNWDDQKNHDVFGKCCNIHGHNYTLMVQVQGPVDPQSGMVINFTDLSALVQNNLIGVLDHKNLETDVPELADKVLTVENLVNFAWEKLACGLKPPVKLRMLRMEETDSSAVEYFGPE